MFCLALRTIILHLSIYTAVVVIAVTVVLDKDMVKKVIYNVGGFELAFLEVLFWDPQEVDL